MYGAGVRALQRVVCAAAFALAFSGCGGGGGASSSAAPPLATPSAPAPATATPVVTAGPTAAPAAFSTTTTVGPAVTPNVGLGPIAGPAGAYSATLGFPATTGATAALTATLSASAPAGDPALASVQRRPRAIGAAGIAPIVYFSATVNASVTFGSTPAVTIALPFSTTQQNAALTYLAYVDASTAAQTGWIVLPIAAHLVNATTLTFPSTALSGQNVAIVSGDMLSFVAFTVPSALPSPAPVPSATPIPSPVPTTAPTQAPTAVPSSSPKPAFAIVPVGFMSPGGGHGGGACPAGSAYNGCPSVYAVSADAAGYPFARIDPSGQTPSLNANLATPANDLLPDSSTNLQYRFTPANANVSAPFVVAVQQIHDGPHQIYYNSKADSQGRVDASTLAAVVRAPNAVRGATAAVRPAAVAVHRGVHHDALAEVASDRLYVRFRASALHAAGGTVTGALHAIGTSGVELRTARPDPLAVVRVPAGTTAQAYGARLRARGDVAATYPVHRRYALAKSPAAVSDAHFKLPDQWYLMTDGFPYAWSYTSGAAATIAVIDTGVDLTNADIAPQTVFSEQVLNGTRSSAEIDNDGHGTNVAGIAAAATNNGVGFAGASNNARLIAIRVFDASGNAYGSDEAIAIDDALAHNADVINLSLGAEESSTSQYEGYDEGEYEAVEAAITSGTVVVAAAGNNRDGTDPHGDGLRHGNLDYPAGYPNVLSVGASQLNDGGTGVYTNATESVAAYSQTGVGLGLVAPGGAPVTLADTDVLHWIWNYYSSAAAANPCSQPSPATSCTAYFAGTSQATPQVSAAAALLISAAGGHGSLTPAQVAQVLESTADNINDPNQGHGRLNVYRALAALLADPGATATGPQPTAHAASQAIAFAYANGGQNRATILDYDFPAGVPVAADGTFRIADVRPQDAASYKVGVWYDANGDGVIDAGDWFGASPVTCSSTAACSIGTIVLGQVGPGFTLP